MKQRAARPRQAAPSKRGTRTSLGVASADPTALAILSTDLEARLRAGLEALEVVPALIPPLAATLLRYLALLQAWGRAINLTAVRDPGSMVTLHLLDCLAAWRAIRLRESPPGAPRRVLDVGSGAGLPGAVWALAEPAWRVTCLDTVAKKAAFIRQVAAELSVPNLEAQHARVESWSGPEGGFDLITSRAFSSLTDFLVLTRHLGHAATHWVAMKGQVPEAELNELPEDFEMFHVERLEVPGLPAQRCLVWIRPRRPGVSELAGAWADGPNTVDKP